MNLDDLLQIPLRRSPDRAALVSDSGASAFAVLSYGELHEAVDRCASALARRGLTRGDRVAFFGGNRPELVIAVLATLRLGAVMVPMNLAYRRRELSHLLSDAEPRLVFTERSQAAWLEEVAPAERRSVEEVLCLEDLPQLLGEAGSAPQVTVEEGDLAFLMYTSGTTGKSKGAMLTHGNTLATVTGLLAAWAWQPSDVLLLTLPLFHTHGLVVGLLTALAAGATVELRRRFDAATVVAELASGEPTCFFGVPTFYVRLVDELRARGASADLSRMRLFCSGSAPLDPETFAAFETLTGQAILERYGMTETGMNLSNPYVGERRPGTVGRELPGVSARIVGASGEPVPLGEPGRLQVSGSNVFAGYWRDPVKTEASFVVDERRRRWFETGDLARRDPKHGAITLLGRSQELILTGGYNVYPREVEEALTAVDGIREAAVVGVAHDGFGQVPVAWLVVDRPLDEAVLIEHLKSQLAGFKVPRRFYLCDALPRNALGKVQKHLLGVDPEGPP